MVGFTRISSGMNPSELVYMLNTIVNGFDLLTEKYTLEKIKTIGDAYFCVVCSYYYMKVNNSLIHQTPSADVFHDAMDIFVNTIQLLREELMEILKAIIPIEH